MLFEVNTFSREGCIVDRPVNWIKAFREDTGCGLKESKMVCDYVRNRLCGQNLTKIVIDTGNEPDFRYLEDISQIRHGQCSMIRMVNRDFNVGMAILAGDDKSHAKFDETTKVLKNAAIRLIRLNSFKQASDVLKILM